MPVVALGMKTRVSTGALRSWDMLVVGGKVGGGGMRGEGEVLLPMKHGLRRGGRGIHSG